jgi:hypothetical protein
MGDEVAAIDPTANRPRAYAKRFRDFIDGEEFDGLARPPTKIASWGRRRAGTTSPGAPPFGRGRVRRVCVAMAGFDSSHQSAPYSEVDRTGLPILLSAYSSR